MHLLDSAGFLARSAAFEVARRYSSRGWKQLFVEQLQSRGVDVVFDVGANSGQYAKGLRRAAYKGRIVSFEPLSRPFSILTRRASSDPLWDCRRCALGDSDGTVSINVAGNGGQSSSVLPMMKSHQDAFPPANYIGTEEVPIYQLDSIAAEFLRSDSASFLKIDVQGFEQQVLAGSKSTVNDSCVGIQLELTFLPLYEGGMLIREALDLMHSLGFTLTGVLPCFMDVHNGRMLQADGIFFREVD
ncbi:FkbM family methyltransferase [Mycobacterium simiae]|uniref:FkbM family methyltransferase n=1 Tax=Mycobacterium simiae TaxID=1784 RepID=A0A5B1BTB0_MYCSI|nr:FkbM family methyltransferase [Mycobacterium simiae]KAA1250524.1 FkbM family methyltransferase [Mycobacterium simiae]